MFSLYTSFLTDFLKGPGEDLPRDSAQLASGNTAVTALLCRVYLQAADKGEYPVLHLAYVLVATLNATKS